jgi:NADPH-dependent curcumin reductase CurA
MPTPSREIHLVRRPEGALQPEDFALVSTEIADPAEGQVLVKNLMMSVDPALRPRMSVGQALNEAISGGAVGRVEKSRNAAFWEGDVVQNRSAFREAFLSDGRGLSKLKLEPGLSIAAHMNALGGPGFTAYGGLLRIGALKDGEQVFVSTAAGAVGAVASQIAKIKGCYVVGSTGSDDKVAWLKDVAGLDAAFNYKNAPVRAQLRELTPKGIDVYFDNVGGDHLDAALAGMNQLGRVAVCGMISGYNEAGSRTQVRNLANIIYGRINIRGFTAADFMDLREQFQSDMAGWLRDGRVKTHETIYDGIDHAAAAMIDLMKGANLGKMLVKLAD